MDKCYDSCGLVVTMLTFYSDNTSSNPAEVINFSIALKVRI